MSDVEPAEAAADGVERTEAAGVRRRRVRRIASDVGGAILVLWGAATVTFLTSNLLPGNPAVAIAGGSGSHPSTAELAAIRSQYGLDKPLVVQYVVYLGRLLRGNLGYSSSQRMQVTTVIGQNIGSTLVLTVAALVAAWVFSLVSITLTVKRGRVRSSIGSGVEVLLAALPQYWLGILLLEVFAFKLDLIPAIGGGGLKGLILPALTLALPLAGFIAQVTREEFESALEQPFILSARSRGMGEWGVRLRHALRLSILPALTLSAWAVGALISGAVIVETLFARQGLGNVLLQGVTQQDIPLTVGSTLVVALVYVVVNLAVDAVHQVADPRLRS